MRIIATLALFFLFSACSTQKLPQPDGDLFPINKEMMLYD